MAGGYHLERPGLESAVLQDPKVYILAEVFIRNINLHAKEGYRSILDLKLTQRHRARLTIILKCVIIHGLMTQRQNH